MLYLKIYYEELATSASYGQEDMMVASRLRNAGFDQTKPYEKDHFTEGEYHYIRYAQQEHFTLYGQFMEQLYHLRNNFISKQGKYPNMVFLGQDEMDLLRLSLEAEYGRAAYYDLKEVMGMEVQETIYDKHMTIAHGLKREQ